MTEETNTAGSVAGGLVMLMGGVGALVTLLFGIGFVLAAL